MWSVPTRVAGAALVVATVAGAVASPTVERAAKTGRTLEPLIGVSAPCRRAEIATEQDGTIV